MKELLSIEDPIAGLLGAWSAGLNLGSALLRIALIVALAASIGCERSSKRHSAGLRTFVLAAFSATVSMLLDQYVYVLLGCKLPLLSAATLLAVTSVSANSILYSSRGQIKGLTTSAGLVSCCILGFATGAGLYALTLIVYVFLLCILAGFPAFEAYLKNRSNHFEVHMELKSSSYLRDFVTVSRCFCPSIPIIISGSLPAFSFSCCFSCMRSAAGAGGRSCLRILGESPCFPCWRWE